VDGLEQPVDLVGQCPVRTRTHVFLLPAACFLLAWYSMAIESHTGVDNPARLATLQVLHTLVCGVLEELQTTSG
jgi:hypothetical protein